MILPVAKVQVGMLNLLFNGLLIIICLLGPLKSLGKDYDLAEEHFEVSALEYLPAQTHHKVMEPSPLYSDIPNLPETMEHDTSSRQSTSSYVVSSI